MLCAVLLCACGTQPAATAPAWRATHPDPQGMTFDENAPGVCAISVRYPDLAPAAIDYLGTIYIQHAQEQLPASAPGTRVATSGDWTVRRRGSQLLLLTASAMFTYTTSASC